MKRWGMVLIAVLLVACAYHSLPPASASADEPWVVHEWGTFTTLQDEQGQALGGINVDDEPVPEFVYNLSPYLLRDSFLTNSHWVYRMKGVPRRHPHVTMRLETPVIYFYPPAGAELPQSVDVGVEFRGGWLTEFYPQAEASAPGLYTGNFEFGELTPETVGGLRWNSVQVAPVADSNRLPQTEEHVWLAPRQTEATDVTLGEESERYLFYRGVGNLDAPLRTTTDRESRQITIRSNLGPYLAAEQMVTRIANAWLVDIRLDGTTAFRELGPLSATADPDAEMAVTGYAFDEEAYDSSQLSVVREQMHRELVAAGLYADEATAMLNTWERAYFISPGLRLFYVVPREWTDAVLPLQIGGLSDVQVERVMMGRIELITERQRELLAQIEAGPITDGDWVRDIPESEASDAFFRGRRDFGDLQVEIPEDYRRYLDLGRFRNALIIGEHGSTGSPTLLEFINTNRLEPFIAR